MQKFLPRENAIACYGSHHCIFDELSAGANNLKVAVAELAGEDEWGKAAGLEMIF